MPELEVYELQSQPPLRMEGSPAVLSTLITGGFQQPPLAVMGEVLSMTPEITTMMQLPQPQLQLRSHVSSQSIKVHLLPSKVERSQPRPTSGYGEQVALCPGFTRTIMIPRPQQPGLSFCLPPPHTLFSLKVLFIKSLYKFLPPHNSVWLLAL